MLTMACDICSIILTVQIKKKTKKPGSVRLKSLSWATQLVNGVIGFRTQVCLHRRKMLFLHVFVLTFLFRFSMDILWRGG